MVKACICFSSRRVEHLGSRESGFGDGHGGAAAVAGVAIVVAQLNREVVEGREG